jgi:rubrerythrin
VECCERSELTWVSAGTGPEKGAVKMTLEGAIKTAIEYEIKIRDVYREAEAAVDDEAGKRIFETLGNDEQHHIDYLQHTLAQLKKTGQIDSAKLESAIPSRETISREAAKIKSMVAKDFHGIRKQMLSRALKAEIETSDFYRKMVDELAAEGRVLFARFLEIENNHINAVQFELDYMSKTGYWFDFKEFDME